MLWGSLVLAGSILGSVDLKKVFSPGIKYIKEYCVNIYIYILLLIYYY